MEVEMTLPAADVRYIVRTTCLLESRAQLYGDYLHRVLPRRFAARVSQWTDEESVHGHLLRDWLATNDPAFDFDASFAMLMTLPYHADTRQDRSPEEELLSRCVVEAFASGFYRALGDATDDPALKAVSKRLMGDEAKHFAGFMAMSEMLPALSTPRKLAVIARRVSELDDDQILFAAHVANHEDDYVRTTSRRRYMGRVYGMYQPDHLQFIQSMLLRTLGQRPSRWAHAGMASALFAALQAKRTVLAA
jgi:hypothetical protein